jgi:hypothetical protein
MTGMAAVLMSRLGHQAKDDTSTWMAFGYSYRAPLLTHRHPIQCASHFGR